MHALEMIFEQVARLSLEASVLAGLVYLTQRIFGRWLSPAWRYALWGLVAVRLVMPLAPQSPVSVFNILKLLPVKKSPTPLAPLVRQPSPINNYEALPPDLLDTAQENLLPSEAGKKTVHRQITWRQGLALVWALGLLALFARYGFGYVLLLVRCRRQYAREIGKDLTSSKASTPSVHAIWEQAAGAFGLRRRVPLLESASISAPALFGFLRPVLLIPAGLSSGLSENQLRHVCFHEAAHLKRCDLLLNGVIALLQLVHWFNPFIWFAFLRMRAERELACDDMALRKLHPEDPAAYGRTILKLVQGIERQSVPLLVGVLESKRGLNERIEDVARFKPKKRSVLPPILLLVVLASVGLSEARKPSSSPDATPSPLAQPAVADRPGEAAVPTFGSRLHDAELLLQLGRPEEAERLLQYLIFDAPRPERGSHEETRKAFAILNRVQNRITPHKNVLYFSSSFQWQKWSKNAVEEARRGGNPVLIQFGADWDLTSQITRKTVLESEAVRKKLEQLGVVIFYADYSEKNDEIAAELKKFEQPGVPLVVIYPANPQGDAIVMPAVLTSGIVIDGLNKVAATPVAGPMSEFNRVSAGQARSPSLPQKKVNPPTAAASPIEVQDARLLLEMGKLDEAEQKLRDFLNRTTINERPPAEYYLQLIAEKRAEQSARIVSGHQAVISKLSKIVLKEFLVPRPVPLSEVAKKLETESKELDPDHEGLNFVFSSGMAREVTVQINPALKNANLNDVLSAIVASAKPPDGADANHQRLNYTIEDYGIVFHLASSLFTRTFKLGPADFIETLRKNSKVPSSQNLSSNELQTMVKEFGRNAGIDLPATEVSKDSNDGNKPNPKRSAIFFNEKTGVLMVRATLAELDHLESVLQNIPPPPENPSAKSLTISLFANTYVVDGGNLTLADLRERIQKAHAKDPSLGIVIEARPDEPYANVTRVIDLCHETGITNLQFATRPH